MILVYSLACWCWQYKFGAASCCFPLACCFTCHVPLRWCLGRASINLGPWVQLISSWERDPQSSEFCQKNLLPLLLSYLEVPLYCKQVTICAMCCGFQGAARQVLSSPSADENDVGTVSHAGSSLADTFSSWSSCCWDCSPVCRIVANSGPTRIFDTPAVYPWSILR